jgi:hypothetical protein
MIRLILPRPIRETIKAALQKAGKREVGGVLMAEHVSRNEFEIKDLTVHRRGSVFNFIRRIEEAVGRMLLFFERTNHEYTRFNYIGEWHSHPLFAPVPSDPDDASMRAIVQDPEIGANFVVLLIVKLDQAGGIVATAHTYLPDGSKHVSIVEWSDGTVH